MSDPTTTNYGFTKPTDGGDAGTWGDKLNANFDSLDTLIKTLSNQIATALSSSGYTAADVLAKLLTVDGSGSGLDADKLDGIDASGFASSTHTHTAYLAKPFGTGTIIFGSSGGPYGPILTQPGSIFFNAASGQGGVYIRDQFGGVYRLGSAGATPVA